MKALIVTRPDGTKCRGNPKRMDEYVNCTIEYRDVTEQEIVDLRIPEAMVTVKIPIQVFMNSQEMQQKIQTLDLLYNWLNRRTIDGYLQIENIDTHDVPEYLSMEEYQRMKTAGVIFPPEIIALFENVEDENENNSDNNNSEPEEPTEDNLNSNEENEEQNSDEEETESAEETTD